ncbi:MAG: glycosyltransferase, partial [Acidimicrobiales bacterium]
MDAQGSGAGSTDPLAAAPSVVAVVVSRDPGPWLEGALAALAAQDYPELSVLILDAASEEDPTARIAAVAPNAFVRRLERAEGFAAAANVALESVEGASFFLFLHDDVELDAAAVRLVVEEAYRSNAGIVGPKVVGVREPRRLLGVGEGVDKFGVASPLAEPGELDQEQHDTVRDVFAVSGCCLLVRADLCRALGGFDREMPASSAAVDLCWRAHLAGARVVVAPAAWVRHAEAGAQRDPDQRGAEAEVRDEARASARMVLGNYGLFFTLAIAPQHLLLSVAQAVVAVAVGRPAQARARLGAYVWCFARLGSLLRKRRSIRGLRRAPDLGVRRLQVRGSARLNAYVRGQLAGREEGPSLAGASRQLLGAFRSTSRQEALAVIAALALLVAFGSRHLLTRPIPTIGQLAAFPDRAGDLVSLWLSGWSPTGLGAAAPNPSALGAFGLLGWAFFGATGLLRRVLILGALPVGLVGAWRLGGRTASRRPRVAALVAYAASPAPYDALASGRWKTLAIYAAAPWILVRLAGAGGGEPYRAPDPSADRAADQELGADQGPRAGANPSPSGRLGWARAAAGLGLIIALAALLCPAAPLLAFGAAAALALGSALCGERRGAGRMLGLGAASAALAVLLHAPWYAQALRADTSLAAWLDAERPDAAVSSLYGLLSVRTGPLGGSAFSLGTVVAALVVLAIGGGWRLAWGVRAWTLTAAAWLLVWLAGRDLLGPPLPAPHGLLVMAAAGLAMAVAMGVSAVERDLSGHRLGWRQAASALGVAGALAAMLPVAAGAVGGRWSMPRGGYERTFAFAAGEAEEVGPYRVLWLGDADVLPLASWPYGTLTQFAASDGVPTLEAMWAGASPAATRQIPTALDLALGHHTNRLGRLLATMGVRYVVVVERGAPAPFGGAERPAPPGLLDALDAQLDLERITLNPAVVTYRNVAWAPTLVLAPPGAKGAEDSLRAAAAVDLAGAARALPDRRGQARHDGPVSAGDEVLLAEAASGQWRLTVDGEVQPRTRSFGWANRFLVQASGSATLRRRTPLSRPLTLAGQSALWAAVAAL